MEKPLLSIYKQFFPTDRATSPFMNINSKKGEVDRVGRSQSETVIDY